MLHATRHGEVQTQDGRLRILFLLAQHRDLTSILTNTPPTDLTVLWIGFFSHWAHLTVLRFIFVYVCILCSIVTWWGEPGEIEDSSLGPLLPSVL